MKALIRHSIALSLLLVACAPAQEGAPKGPADTGAEDAPTNRIDIPASVRSNLGITFAKVEVRNVARTIRVPGAFELQPLARREYRMALSGHVEVFVDQYERVEPGQVLYRYRSPQWPGLLHEIIVAEQEMDTASAEIDVGRAKTEEARSGLELLRSRLDALADAKLKRADLEAEAAQLEASLPRLEAEVRLAETKLANAQRTREHALHRAAAASGLTEEALEAEVTVGGESVPAYETIEWIEVTARGGGVVERLVATDGAFVEPPEVVLTIVDPSRVRFRALALQADLPRLSGKTEARIVPPPSPEIPIEEGVAADMTIGLEAHPQERTVTVLATPRESQGWVRPGVSAFLEVIVASEDAPTLAVPRSAVLRDGLMHVVFRRDPADPNKAIRIEADLGTSDGRWVVLKSGVMRGDEVVLDGAYELNLASQQSGVGEAGGHVHADGTYHDDH